MKLDCTITASAGAVFGSNTVYPRERSADMRSSVKTPLMSNSYVCPVSFEAASTTSRVVPVKDAAGCIISTGNGSDVQPTRLTTATTKRNAAYLVLLQRSDNTR